MNIKRIISIVLLFAGMAVLFGCAGKTDAGESAADKTETASVSDFLKEELPKAVLESEEPVVTVTEDGAYIMTNYVSGQYREYGLLYDYCYNKRTGAFFTSKRVDELRMAVQDYLIRKLGAAPETAEVMTMTVGLYLPDQADFAEDDPLKDSFIPFQKGLVPYDITDFSAFVKDSGSRGLIAVVCEVITSDTVDYSAYSLDRFYTEALQEGFYFESLGIRKDIAVRTEVLDNALKVEHLPAEYFYKRGQRPGGSTELAGYEKWEDADFGDFTVHGCVFSRTETLDTASGAAPVTAELVCDLSKDIQIEKAPGKKAGYTVRRSVPSAFFILAEETSEIRQKEYMEKRLDGQGEPEVRKWYQLEDGRYTFGVIKNDVTLAGR